MSWLLGKGNFKSPMLFSPLGFCRMRAFTVPLAMAFQSTSELGRTVALTDQSDIT